MDRASPHRNSYLEIEHDIDYQTVYNLTDYILLSLFREGYRSVTVGECLGDPPANWYRRQTATATPPSKSHPGSCGERTTTTGGKTDISSTTIRKSSPSSTSSVVIQPPSQTEIPEPEDTGCPSSSDPGQSAVPQISHDGRCGVGVTCQGSRFGDCCSQSGYCGRTPLYCGGGCQADVSVKSLRTGVQHEVDDTLTRVEVWCLHSSSRCCSYNYLRGSYSRSKYGNLDRWVVWQWQDMPGKYVWRLLLFIWLVSFHPISIMLFRFSSVLSERLANRCGSTPVHCGDDCDWTWGECWGDH